jgi:DNA-binding beta-propeller fold protein YncE
VLRTLSLVLLALALSSGGASARSSGGAEEAYVAVEEDDLVVSVMLDTGEVTSRISVPPGPRHVAIGSDRRLVLVSSPPAGRVTVIDSFRHRVIETFEGFGSPRGIEIDGRYAYVADAERGEIVVLDLDLEASKIVGRVRVGAEPHDVSAGGVGLVTHGPSGRRLTVLDLSRPHAPRVLGTMRAGGSPLGIAGQPYTSNAYLTYWRSGAVGAVDSRRRRVRWRRTLGSVLQDLTYAYNGRLWVTDSRSGNVLSLRASDGRVFRRLRGCPGARGVHFGPGRGHIVAACHDAGTLLVLDPVRERSSRIKVGDGPVGVAVAFVP